MMKTFNDIIKFNWAWIFLNEQDVWVQFDCLDCMILESKYQQWTENNEEVITMIKMGIVDFAKMTITHHIKDQNTECNQKVTKIKRKEYNRKVRPDAAKR